MRIARAVPVSLMCSASVIVLGLLVYSPLLVAWSNRHEFAGGTVVQFSRFMQQADVLYAPLAKFHASLYGYDHLRSFDEKGNVWDMTFVKRGAIIHP